MDKDELKALFAGDGDSPTAQRVRRRLFTGLIDFLNSERVTVDADLTSLAARFQNGQHPDHTISSEEYLELLAEKVVPYSINMASPRCLGHMTGAPPNFVKPVGELILALNQNLVKVEASKVFTVIERQTLGMLHKLVYGRPAWFYERYAQDINSALGIIASGATLANITALWIARNASLGATDSFAGVEEAGLPAALRFYGYTDAVIIASNAVHYSIDKAAGLLGLGAKGLLKINVDHRNRMDVATLRAAVQECNSRRVCILAIVGIAGTTDSGSIDPLTEIGEVAREFNIHFHVDAAWGAPLLFSRSHRDLLSGISQADSVTVDGHKHMHLPIGCSALLLDHPKAADVIEKRSHYILHSGSGDLGRHSLEGSRDAGALFLHAALHVIGRAGYELLVDESFSTAQMMAAAIRNREEFELLADVETNILLYRYIPEECRKRENGHSYSDAHNVIINECNERIQKEQFKAGRTFVSRIHMRNTNGGEVPILALRAVIANPLTTEADVEAVLDDQLTIASEIESDLYSRAGSRTSTV